MLEVEPSASRAEPSEATNPAPQDGRLARAEPVAQPTDGHASAAHAARTDPAKGDPVLKRLLTPLALALVLWLPAAALALPESFTLLCDGALLGTGAFDDGELEVTLFAGASCAGSVSVAEDGDLFVEVVLTEAGVSVTVTGPDGAVTATEVAFADRPGTPDGDEPTDRDVRATGLDRADEAAGEHGAHGRARARAAQAAAAERRGGDDEAQETGDVDADEVDEEGEQGDEGEGSEDGGGDGKATGRGAANKRS